jgi:hypothetical protein
LCFVRSFFQLEKNNRDGPCEKGDVYLAVGRTTRFSFPTIRPSRISRASSEWPTSSKASVASWPPTSRRTSSPPLYVRYKRLAIISPRSVFIVCDIPYEKGISRIGNASALIGEEGSRGSGCDIRMLINESRCIVHFVVDDYIEIFFRRVVRDFGVGDFFRRGHFG